MNERKEMSEATQLREAIETWQDFLHSAHGCEWDEPVAVAILRVNEAAEARLRQLEADEAVWPLRYRSVSEWVGVLSEALRRGPDVGP